MPGSAADESEKFAQGTLAGLRTANKLGEKLIEPSLKTKQNNLARLVEL